MATLEEQRRASGQAMQDARRANGQRIEAERRAIGNRMIEERTGKSVANDINRLTTPPRQRKTLRTIQPVGGIPAGRGRADYKAPASAAGGGIASPLTEVTRTEGGQVAPDRDYWPSINMYSSDGLMTFKLAAIKQANFTDANGAAIAINYAEVPE